MRPWALGILLGAINVLVIGLGMSFAAGDRELQIAMFVMIFGIVPGVVLGALLGWLAEVMAPLPVWLRRFVLCLPAMLLVMVMAVEFSMQHFILVACIPTLVAAFVLERATRLVATPPVPVAHARRGS
jgi:ABC-type dipeptide/oligopeptide/nickel transport system permease subunit